MPLVWPPRDFQSNRFQDFAYLASKVPDQVSMIFNLLRLRSELVVSSFQLGDQRDSVIIAQTASVVSTVQVLK